MELHCTAYNNPMLVYNWGSHTTHRSRCQFALWRRGKTPRQISWTIQQHPLQWRQYLDVVSKERCQWKSSRILHFDTHVLRYTASPNSCCSSSVSNIYLASLLSMLCFCSKAKSVQDRKVPVNIPPIWQKLSTIGSKPIARFTTTLSMISAKDLQGLSSADHVLKVIVITLRYVIHCNYKPDCIGDSIRYVVADDHQLLQCWHGISNTIWTS
jgi:hypothetical protein